MKIKTDKIQIYVSLSKIETIIIIYISHVKNNFFTARLNYTIRSILILYKFNIFFFFFLNNSIDNPKIKMEHNFTS